MGALLICRKMHSYKIFLKDEVIYYLYECQVAKIILGEFPTILDRFFTGVTVSQILKIGV